MGFAIAVFIRTTLQQINLYFIAVTYGPDRKRDIRTKFSTGVSSCHALIIIVNDDIYNNFLNYKQQIAKNQNWLSLAQVVTSCLHFLTKLKEINHLFE